MIGASTMLWHIRCPISEGRSFVARAISWLVCSAHHTLCTSLTHDIRRWPLLSLRDGPGRGHRSTRKSVIGVSSVVTSLPRAGSKHRAALRPLQLVGVVRPGRAIAKRNPIGPLFSRLLRLRQDSVHLDTHQRTRVWSSVVEISIRQS